MANGKPGRPAKCTDEYKRNAVDYYLQSGKSQRECAGDLGIPHKTLSRWVRDRDLSDEEREAAAELRELRREVERLRVENEFLKKAAVILPRFS